MGTAEVEALAQSRSSLCCGFHGRTEFASVVHRKVREGTADAAWGRHIFSQLERDSLSGGILWLELTAPIFIRAELFFLNAPPHTFLRASDALHLACAAEHGFKEIYSNDQHLLTAAPHFGLKGLNVIPTL